MGKKTFKCLQYALENGRDIDFKNYTATSQPLFKNNTKNHTKILFPFPCMDFGPITYH